MLWGAGFGDKVSDLLSEYGNCIVVDPIVAAAPDGADFPGAGRTFPFPLDGGSVSIHSQLDGKVNGFIGIDTPYVGKLKYIRPQLLAALIDLFERRKERLPALLAFFHTTRTEKWLSPLRAFFLEAERRQLGRLTVDDAHLWYDSKPIAQTTFEISDTLPVETALQQISQLASFVNQSQRAATLDAARRNDSSLGDVRLAALDEAPQSTGFDNVAYNTESTSLSAAGAYRIVVQKHS